MQEAVGATPVPVHEAAHGDSVACHLVWAVRKADWMTHLQTAQDVHDLIHGLTLLAPAAAGAATSGSSSSSPT